MSSAFLAGFTAGDLFDRVLSLPAHPASAGWTCVVFLIGPGRQQITATAEGDAHRCTKAPADTAGWPPGLYEVRAVASQGAGQRASYTIGQLCIAPDPAAAGTDARALLSAAERALADLEAAYRAHLSTGSAVVAEYEIAGRRMKFRDAADLLRFIQMARRDVAAEQAAKRLSAGLSPRQQIVTRM